MMINAEAGLAASATPGAADSWWFAARLHDDDTAFWIKIHTVLSRDSCASIVAVAQEPDGYADAKFIGQSPGDVTLAADSFVVRTAIVSMSGDLDSFEISGVTDTASARLLIERTEPVLYNGGAGTFPLFGGMTTQYSLPGLVVSGTIVIDGVTRRVSGSGWFDRQWLSADAIPGPFTWLGLDLGPGRYLSVWDTTGDGTSWLTELRADGTHTITHARRAGGDGRWELTIPALDAALVITYHELPGIEGGLHTAVCAVDGTISGCAVTGHGYADFAR